MDRLPGSTPDAPLTELRELFADPEEWLDPPNWNLGGETPRDVVERGRSEVGLDQLMVISHIGVS